MSYDLRLGVKVEGIDLFAVIDEPEYASPTYNIGEMLRKAMDWDFNQGEWYRVSDVIDNIQRGITELTIHEDRYKKYNPSNGWGSTTSANKALKSLLKCIECNVKEGYAWQAIPVEHLWVRW